jgi:hypothetical protein
MTGPGKTGAILLKDWKLYKKFEFFSDMTPKKNDLGVFDKAEFLP